MRDYLNRLIYEQESIRTALEKINWISNYHILDPLALFVLNEENKMVGTLTDGDIRRNLLRGHSIDEPISAFMNRNFRYLRRKSFTVDEVKELYKYNVKMVPVLNEKKKIIKIYDLTKHKTILPVDAVIMAGGEGKRLRPLTENVPKPLLKVGDKPIIEHNIDHLYRYGIDNIKISIRYLGKQLVRYFGNGHNKNVHITYVRERKPLGTMGALALIKRFEHDYILMMNSDLLTTINYECFFRDFVEKGVDMAVAAVPYEVKVPYAVLHVNNERIISLKEKPEMVYHSNAGIYLIRKELIKRIPKNQFWDVTDFMEDLIQSGGKIAYFPLAGYWLDIGKHEDYIQAQRDIKLIEI